MQKDMPTIIYTFAIKLLVKMAKYKINKMVKEYYVKGKQKLSLSYINCPVLYHSVGPEG